MTAQLEKMWVLHCGKRGCASVYVRSFIFFFPPLCFDRVWQASQGTTAHQVKKWVLTQDDSVHYSVRRQPAHQSSITPADSLNSLSVQYTSTVLTCIPALSAPTLKHIHPYGSAPTHPWTFPLPLGSPLLRLAPFANPLLVCWTCSQTRFAVLEVDTVIKLFQASGIMLLSMRGTLDEAICHTDRIALSGFSGTQRRIKTRTDSSVLSPPLFFKCSLPVCDV